MKRRVEKKEKGKERIRHEKERRGEKNKTNGNKNHFLHQIKSPIVFNFSLFLMTSSIIFSSNLFPSLPFSYHFFSSLLISFFLLLFSFLLFPSLLFSSLLISSLLFPTHFLYFSILYFLMYACVSGISMHSLAQFKLTFESLKDLLTGSANSLDLQQEEKDKEKGDRPLTALPVEENNVLVHTGGMVKNVPAMFPTTQMVGRREIRMQ